MSDPFMIRAHVPHWEASVADYCAASEATRQRSPGWRTVAYGDGPDETLDLYFPADQTSRARPIHMFVHGGYWRAFSKNEYAFVADAVNALGAIAAIVDYSLMPKARMAELVRQTRRAAHWLAANAPSFGGDARRLSASGHSAGGHLASYLAARGPHEPEAELPRVRAVALISGLYDLAPISRSFLQPELQLSAEEIALWSPVAAEFSPAARVTLLVGAKETPPFHQQAAALKARLDPQNVRNALATVPDEDHMTIVREFGRPGSASARWLEATIASD
jgi:arylformamidase